MDESGTRPDLLELDFRLGGRTFYGRLLSDAARPMDFLARLDGRSASVQVFQPNWRTFSFLVAAGPFKYRGRYVIGQRHLQAQMQTLGAGPPQQVQVSIDLESLNTIAMKVTTNGGDGQRRSIVFAYGVETEKFSVEFNVNLPSVQRGIRCQMRRGREDWSSASADVVLASDGLNHMTGEYDFTESTMMMQGSATGVMFPDLTLELRKAERSFKASVAVDEVVHETYGSLDAPSVGVSRLKFGLQSPVLPIAPLTASVVHAASSVLESASVNVIYGDLRHIARAQLWRQGERTTLAARLDTPLFGLKDVSLALDTNGTVTDRTVSATMTAFEEVSRLEASATLEAPYDLRVNVDSSRLPAGNVKIFASLDARSHNSLLVNGSILSGNHETGILCRYEMVNEVSLENKIGFHSTVWPVSIHISNFISTQDGLYVSSKLKSSIEAISHYEVNIEFLPDITKAQYHLQGNLTTPMVGGQNLKLKGVFPKQMVLLTREPAYLLLHGDQHDINFYIASNSSDDADGLITSRLKLPSAQIATEVTLQWGNEWKFHLTADEPFVQFVPCLVMLATDKSSEVTAKVEYGSNKIHMLGNLQNLPELRTLSFSLKTPFTNYEEFGIVGRLENGTRKGIQAEITYLGKVIGTHADFFLDGFNIIARASLRTPFEQFSGFVVDVTNLIDLSKLSYEGIVLGRVGSYEVSATIDGAFVSSVNAHLELGGVIGANLIKNRLALSEDRQRYQISNTLETSSEAVQFVHLSAFKGSSTESFHAGLSCNMNSVSVISLEGQGILTDFRITVENPWQPVSLEWFYENEINSTMRLLGVWDLLDRENNNIGITVMLTMLPTDMTMRVETVFFERTLSLEGTFDQSSTRLHNSLLFQIDGGSGVGYDILFRDSSQFTQAYYLIQGDIKVPNRVISLTGTHQQRVDLRRNDVLLQWDAVRFPEKRMSAFAELKSNSIWESWQSLRYNISLGLTHSALDHDVVLDSSVEIFPVSRSLKTASILRYTKDSAYDLVVDASFLNRSTEAASLFDVSVRGSQTISGLNVTMYSSTVSSAQLIAQNVSFAYRNKLSEVEAFSIHALWDRPRREALAHLVTRLHDVSLRGTHEVPVNGVHVLRVVSDFDGTRRPIEISVQTRTPTKPLELRLDATYEKDRKLSLFAGMPTARLVTLRATRNLYGMHVDDASVSVRLNSSQLLSAVVQWRWQIAIDVKRRAVARLMALSADAQSWLADMTRFVQDEAARKERFIQPVINRKWAAVVAYTGAEYAAVTADFRHVRDEWRTRYERDDLFMRTIHDVIKSYLQRGRHVLSLTTTSTQKAFTAVKAALGGIIEDLQQGYGLLLRAVRLFSSSVQEYVAEEIAAIRVVASEIGETVQLLVDTVQSLVDVVWSSVTSLASSSWSAAKAAGSRALAALRWAVSPLLNGLGVGGGWVVRQISESVGIAVNAFNELVDQVKESLYELVGVFKTQLLDIFYLNSVKVSTPKWLSSLPGVEFLGTVASTAKHALFFTYESAVKFIQYNQDFLREAWVETSNLLAQIPDDIPPVRILVDWLRRVYSETAWAWNYWEEGNQIKEAAVWIMDSMSESSNTTSRPSGLNITDNSYIKFFPADGYLQANVPLLFKWDNFNKLPKFGKNETAETDRLGLDIVYFYYELLDYINRISPLFTAQEWLPPYDARALIAGSQHYITFDDKFYEFAGGCSYLLAADLKQQSFALVVHYVASRGRAERRSLSVFHGNHSLKLVQGRSLFLDDRRVELPFRLGSTVVSRVGSRTVIDLGHSRVECSVAFDVCTFQLSGRFHGRTGGLLGTYTNEQADDFTGPAGKIFTRTDSFARKWEVRGDRRYCRAKNLAIRASSGGNDPRSEAACGALFADAGSALRPCYGIVNTAPFMRMCLNDLEAHYNSPGRFLLVCTAAAAYVAECITHGVDSWMPPQCVRCELEDGNVLHAAESKLYRFNAPRIADVVVVVERRACQRGRNFRQTMRDVDQYLHRRGITQNRFAIIGFGGDDIYRRPHIETIKGSIWGNSRAAGQALDRAKGILAAAGDDDEAPDEAGVFEAIREACRLPFRGGVSKQIVLFSCSSCPYLEAEFPFTLNVLNLMDVTLHIVAETKFQLKKASRQHESKVVALSSHLAFTYKDLYSRRRAGDALLHPHVRKPKDLCSPLAIETNGTVFDAGRWGKPLRHLLAEVMAEAADPSPCQECDCFADRDGVGKLECRTCLTPTLRDLLVDFEPDFSDVEDPAWFQDYHTMLDSNTTDVLTT